MRKVPTASGATAVQIVDKRGGRRRIVEHLGSAHGDAELAALMQVGRDRLHEGQLAFDLALGGGKSSATVVAHKSRLLIDVIAAAWRRLGFDAISDEAFFQLVLARLVEPTSKTDSRRVIAELGLVPVHRNTFTNALARCAGRDYRDTICRACFDYVWAGHGGDVSLLLYDVTTLYFEAEKEDELRKVGFSKERRVDPQIVVGLLVDRSGFPLEISCHEGNKAETATIIPVLKGFQERNNVSNMVVVADAGMLSASNLTEIDKAGLKFIVGARQTRAPLDLADHFQTRGTRFDDGQIIETCAPRHRGQKHPGGPSWRVVWQYSRKRFVRDNRTVTQQRNRAVAIIDGDRPPHKARFVKTTGQTPVLDEVSIQRARDIAGLKGYVTNIDAGMMNGSEIIGNYHDLWHVEQSFRMAKTDLAARPIFHHTRDAIEAHLTVVFAALAIARDLQQRSQTSIRKIIRTLRPLQEVTIEIAGHQIQATPTIPDDTAELLGRLGH